MRSVQEMMGHADLNTAKRSVRLAREQMDKEMQAHGLESCCSHMRTA